MSTDDPRDERPGVPPEDAPPGGTPGGDLPPPPPGPGQGGPPGAGWQQPGPQAGYPQQPGYPQGQWQPAWQEVGVVPPTVGGPYNGIGLVILLYVVTCGIWGAFWSYRTSEDLKKYNGDGLGGVLAVVIFLLVHPVLMFTIPNEVEKMYQRDGRESPVNALWGLWFLLPIIGYIVWYVKVQSALNDFWLSKGAQPA